MSALNCPSGSRRHASLCIVLALAAAAQFPDASAAEPRLPVTALFKLDLTWTASLVPVPAAPMDAPEPAPLLSFDDAPNRLLSQVPASPGLQFSLDPDNEEVFLGWQFEF
mgnify:CR=1 FL=1